MDNPSITGSWLGTYYYDWPGHEPCQFEASFTAEGEGIFRGRILDDGPLGEANVEGKQTETAIHFVKVYIAPPRDNHTSPIHCDGTLSTDGSQITGTWEIPPPPDDPRRDFVVTGTWEARRLPTPGEGK
jgi:hypothetical protein